MMPRYVFYNHAGAPILAVEGDIPRDDVYEVCCVVRELLEDVGYAVDTFALEEETPEEVMGE